MGTQLNSLITPNLRLFNLLFRHQVYLEGVKAGLAAQYIAVLRQLYREFAQYLLHSRYATLDQFTRGELQNFIRRFQLTQTQSYNQYTSQLIDTLQKFLAADVNVVTAIHDNVGLTSKPNATPIYGLDAIAGTDAGNEKLWNEVKAEPIPNGQMLTAMIDGFVTVASNQVIAAVRQGYGNGWTAQETLKDIAGDSEISFRDGLFRRFAMQNAAMIGAAVQHISSQIQAAISSNFATEYTWLADYRISKVVCPICRSRDGLVYKYDTGPFPPAHYGCNCVAIPKIADQPSDVPSKYLDWLHMQPEAFIADAEAAKALTISQFESKLTTILQ